MADETPRAAARRAAEKALADGEPLRWFEELYAAGELDAIPWADMEPNPNVVAALSRRDRTGEGLRALKVGCGLGDDAEELARHGFHVTAFDIAPAAIEWARKRFPDSQVDYLVADLLNPPRRWKRAFDFVLESYTLQVLPASLRREAMTRIASFVKPGGTLLVIARAREAHEPIGRMPWPLTREELLWFGRLGLQQESFEDFWDQEDPPVRRFRIAYRMPPEPRPSSRGCEEIKEGRSKRGILKKAMGLVRNFGSTVSLSMPCPLPYGRGSGPGPQRPQSRDRKGAGIAGYVSEIWNRCT